MKVKRSSHWKWKNPSTRTIKNHTDNEPSTLLTSHIQKKKKKKKPANRNSQQPSTVHSSGRHPHEAHVHPRKGAKGPSGGVGGAGSGGAGTHLSSARARPVRATATGGIFERGAGVGGCACGAPPLPLTPGGYFESPPRRWGPPNVPPAPHQTRTRTMVSNRARKGRQ